MDRVEASPDPEPARLWVVMGALQLAALSFSAEQSVVAPAIPQIARQLDVPTASASWLLTGFFVSAAVSTGIVGKLGDVYGNGRVLTLVLLCLSVGSLICAVASTIEGMVLGRVVQGLGAGIFPLTYGIVRDTFPRHRVALGLGISSSMFGIGAGIGLPLSGLILDVASFEWIFVVGLLGLPAAVVANFAIPDSPAERAQRVDWPGAITLAAGLGPLLLALS